MDITPHMLNHQYMTDAAARHAVYLMNKIGDKKAAKNLNISVQQFQRIICKDFNINRDIYLNLLKLSNDIGRKVATARFLT